jgi:hypothetical protein
MEDVMMQNKKCKQLSLAVVVVVVALLSPGMVALVQAGEGYELTWWTVDGGGVGQDAILPYSLGGTAGQPDAALWQGGAYTLQGGFWHDAGLIAEHYIYLPLVLRQS